MPPRCLVVERHSWETGFQREQLQIPKDAFRRFFGRVGDINIDIFAFLTATTPTRSVQAKLSYYRSSATYRINRVDELGNLHNVFVFIQEVLDSRANVQKYELWWNTDVAMVGAKFSPWEKAQDSQHGRGRLWRILSGKISRQIRW